MCRLRAATGVYRVAHRYVSSRPFRVTGKLKNTDGRL